MGFGFDAGLFFGGGRPGEEFLVPRVGFGERRRFGDVSLFFIAFLSSGSTGGLERRR